MTHRTTFRLPGSVRCGAAAMWVALVAAGCSSGPATEGSANAAAAEQSVSGSLQDWQDAVCRDDAGIDSGTRHTVAGSACVPHDGDGIVHFDHFESAESKHSVLSWSPSAHVAEAVVDRPDLPGTRLDHRVESVRPF